ncbi:MAG: hypothetical protein ACHQUC_09850, partial [Chlamydiales bacterium]
MIRLIYSLFCFSFFCFGSMQAENLYLKDNLQRAIPGDYVVVSSNKTITLMHIFGRQGEILTIEEIAMPESRKPKMHWREWVQNHAPGSTSWVMYEIDLKSGRMLRYYSFTKRGWFEIAEADNFLSKLLNLRLNKIPDKDRKKVGMKIFSGSEESRFWQPNLVVDGKIIRGVKFDAWRTRWPKDSSDLSGKAIEVYLPQDNQSFPSYFPYWLQIHGTIGKARVRMIDSGSGLESPK